MRTPRSVPFYFKKPNKLNQNVKSTQMSQCTQENSSFFGGKMSPKL